MNTDYLDTLPEIKNKFKVSLQPGEKVIFYGKTVGLFYRIRKAAWCR